MPKRIYNGSHAEVEVPLPDGSVVTVKKGDAGEFPDEFAKTLDAQDTWATPKTATTAEKE